MSDSLIHPGEQAVTPWYRSVWPWALMAGPAFVGVGGAYATWLAASTFDGLVADDYYKRGMAINRTLARNEYGARIGLSAAIRIDAAGDVRVSLARARGDAEWPLQVRLRLAHPTRAGEDRAASLSRVSGDTYAGYVDPPGAGRRIIIVETDQWRLSGVATLDAATELVLAAPDPAVGTGN
jgi:hypothetical protein